MMPVRLLPFVFVLLWSTGFIAAKYGLPYSGPYTLLAIRFSITIVLLSAVVVFLKPSFPQKISSYGHLLIVGLLIQVAYLGGVFSAIKLGLPAGITAVIVGAQPVLTVLLIHRFQSKLILLAALFGFIGLILVIFGTDQLPLQSTISIQNCIPAIVALLGITIGTIYQKKYCADISIVVNSFIQFVPTSIAFILLAFAFESGEEFTIIWHLEFILAISWLVIVLSIGAILLMNLLYQQNSASSAASYFYLSPPVTLIMSYVLFGETITMLNLVGITMVILSVYCISQFQDQR